ncbi:MarR family winged helix-turn-helix transcriptional regulator [Candidatus Methanoprimaticola sp. MG2]|uniref:MarR family winged helix-turn-helix transcriptional regulator n=1 Tax=Candidatus Methanoprimaticola sp. MG2 TaxID=3228838 RepID=UPI0039C73102
MAENKELIDLMIVFPKKMSVICRALVEGYLKDSRIKPPHLLILSEIQKSEGVSQKDLCKTIPFDKSYISTGVRDLIGMGLVVNEGVGKTHSLRLTESGRDVVVMSDMMFDLLEKSIMEAITEEERDQLYQILSKIDVHVDELTAEYSSRQNS